MGNVISVQCGDALTGRCWDCIAKKSEYICRLEDNLDALEAAKVRLREKRSDVNWINQQRVQMEQPEQVSGWLRRAAETIEQANELLTRGQQERQNLCLAGCCSKNCFSSYKFGKSVARSLDRVNALIAEEAQLKREAAIAPAQQLESDLKQLKKEKDKLQALKKDLQARISLEEGPEKRTLEVVKLWLSNVETLLTKADRLISDGPQELNNSFADTVVAVLKDIVSLHSEGYFTEVTTRAGPARVVERNLKPTVGTEEMLEEAWSVLQKVEVGILGIYGMGGVGKTTLLTLINNKFASTSNDFDLVIWVVVSKDLNLYNIRESIWKQIRSSHEGSSINSSQQIKQDIFNVLKGKKFVLLLDDVWRQFDLEEIGVPLSPQRNGSKIVLTTRSFDVCKQMEATQTMKVKPLNWEEAWQLFREKVGNINAGILQVAQKVAEECRGLPIALITIGRAMASRSTYEEWEHALKVLRRSVSNLQGTGDELYQDMEVRVFERLKFSYDSLPNDILKSCFLYCALFPEDFEIYKDNLVCYWVGEKYCGRHEGYGILYTLIRQCLIQEEERDHVKLHDVVRDMALWIACKCEKEKHMFFTQAGTGLIQLPDFEEWEGAKKVSFMSNSFKSIEGSPRCRDLVTLFLCNNNELKFISEGFFQFMTRLTVLDLSHTKIRELPLGITELQSLEFLNLSFTDLQKLPIELKSLTRLKYLNLKYTVSLEMIPVEVISTLSKLQVLNMFSCGVRHLLKVENNVLSDENMFVKELMSLKNLSELSLSVSSASFFHSICRNKKLLNCLQYLYLRNFNDETAKSLNISSLATAKQLFCLYIFGNGCLEELIVEEREIYAPGISLSNNMLSFCALREVIFKSNKSMRHMTFLIFAPNLAVLIAISNENMEEIISAEILSEHQATADHFNFFEKLQFLCLYDLRKLKTICPVAQSFPCLTKITIRACPALKKLPLKSESVEGCNVVITGEESWWNELTWEDHQTQAAFSSSFQKI